MACSLPLRWTAAVIIFSRGSGDAMESTRRLTGDDERRLQGSKKANKAALSLSPLHIPGEDSTTNKPKKGLRKKNKKNYHTIAGYE